MKSRVENSRDPVSLDRKTVLRRPGGYWLVRRGQDIILSLLALTVLWPLMLAVCIAVVADSPGTGPIFVQTRIGQDGKPFRLYKFRSMVPNAEAKLEELLPFNEMDGPAFKMKADPRITRVGRIIRRTGIDELPQLINILRGDMSIVGPRPSLPREVEQYDDYARQRLLVPAGLTCYWQIMPYRNRLSFEDWIELDLQYIRERSFLTDWKIIIATIGTIFGMYGE